MLPFVQRTSCATVRGAPAGGIQEHLRRVSIDLYTNNEL